MNETQISVIVLTYNSDFEKLKKTLLSVIAQRNVEFEVVVCDDGSKKKCFDDIKSLFEERGFERYTFVDNEENHGTIKNYLSGLYKAKGEYAYGISAGDMFYDEDSLYKCLKFAKENNTDILFGDAVCYNVKDGDIKIYNETHNPRRPEIYNLGSNVKKAKQEMFLGDQAIGAAYFRKTEVAVKYFEKISALIRYAEDNPSTLFAYEDGMRINHFDEKIVWYEYATGLSDINTSGMAGVIVDEFKVIYEALAKEYKGAVEDCAYLRTSIDSKKKKVITCFFRHPLIYTSHLIYQKMKSPTYFADEIKEKENLKIFLNRIEITK